MTNRHAHQRVGMLFLIYFVAACASTPQTRLLSENPPDIPQLVELSEVPFNPQIEYYCGPAALASIISYRGIAVSPEQLGPLIYVPGLKGSLQAEVVSATRQFDLLPVELDGRLDSILREIAAGNPVFVLQNLGLDIAPVWHYEVVIGYDIDAGIFILRSGEHKRIYREFAVFERVWQRAGYWALSIVDARSIPASANEQRYLDAVIDMESVGRVETARIAYQTAIVRWPQSTLALTGLGNTAYAMNDYAEAEVAFQAALDINPLQPSLWNNLAYTLAQLGRNQPSLAAIKQAIQLDPENQNFKDSLDELVSWQ
ncbi:MAG: tetratricopeptide (TPR) repeat protein [Planctomycetota bacterium]|jgi:tetratricopeptide (TPR) repeat protein